MTKQQSGVIINTGSVAGHTGGGIMMLTSKSGTNQYHGTAYDYFVNEAFNANTPWINTKPVARRITQEPLAANIVITDMDIVAAATVQAEVTREHRAATRRLRELREAIERVAADETLRAVVRGGDETAPAND